MSDQTTSSATKATLTDTAGDSTPPQANPSETRYCKDCQFFEHSKSNTPYCLNDRTKQFDIVFGPQSIRCRRAREDETLCGFDGKLFAPALNLVSDVV